MVFYRKYRPQTISELDSSQLRETLTAVLSRPEIPHAFLLTGPKGLGKTSTARIIAKVVNCEHIQSSVSSSQSLAKDQRPETRDQVEPDNICDQCISITNGSNIDVLEIDGASNRGIDEIRDLRDKVKLAPSRAKKKVYIIDEVHMLTTEAFNALLKTIEEPPSHVMFVFCTTEPQKVPATILSRCFHVGYTLATEEDLVRAFERIVQAEKIDITSEALHMIARLSDGGFRDGTKILEELVTLAQGKKITEALVEEKYKVSHISHFVSSLLEYLSMKDVKKSVHLISELVQQGVDIKYCIAQLLEFLHEMLLMKIGVQQNTKYQILHTKYSIEDIQTLVSLFSQAYQDSKYAVIPQLPLELAVITWCQERDEGLMINDKESSVIANEVKQSEPVIPAKAGIQGNGSRIKSGMTLDTLAKKEKNLKVQKLLRGDASPKTKEKIDEKTGQEELSDKTTTEQFMENLIYKVKPLNFSIAGVLRGCTIKKLTSEEVIFQTMYAFHKERLDEGKTQEILSKAIKEITGKNPKVMIELKQ